MRDHPRRPLPQLTWIALVVLLGLSSRHFARVLPTPVAAFAGDTLWATAAFLGIGLVLSRASTATVAALAITVSVLVELSQLYHTTWIDAIRHTTLGALVLGSGFVWTDLACYALGVGLGMLLERGPNAWRGFRRLASERILGIRRRRTR